MTMRAPLPPDEPDRSRVTVTGPPRSQPVRGWFIVLVGALAITVAIVVVMQARLEREDLPRWATIAGALLTGIGVVVELVALVAAARSGALRIGARSAVRRLPATRRGQLARMVMRGVIAPDQDTGHLVAMAKAMRDQQWMGWVYGGLSVMLLGQAISWSAPASLLLAVAAVASVMAAAVVRRQAVLAERFLAGTQPRDDEPAGGPG